ncbi:MAG: flagellar basal body-associated FliL family protein [Gallionellaceae bacterium]|jgi:flagellar FliL protein
MQKFAEFILRSSWRFLFVISCLYISNASAQSSEGGGAAGSAIYQKLEPFTVNLAGMQNVIQLTVTLKISNPDLAAKASLYVPAIRHEMIILLCEKTPEQISSAEGKHQLMLETKEAVNKALHLEAKDGISDVLFESIIIQ